MLHAQLAALTLAAITLVASGCGESSKTTSPASTAASTPATTSSTTTASATTPQLPAAKVVKVATGTPLTRVQLIARGDAICANTNKKLETVSITSKTEANRAFPEAAVFYGDEVRELTKLVPPASMSNDWGLIISDFHRYVEYTDAVARAAEAKNIAAIEPLVVSAETVHKNLNAIAKRNGLKGC